MNTMTVGRHNLHGQGFEDHEEYHMPPDPHGYWAAVTNVPCPVADCPGTIIWWEAGFVPGYRVCLEKIGVGIYGEKTMKHKFIAKGDGNDPILVRDHCCE